MTYILFDRQFINSAGNDLVTGKIHTIRGNGTQKSFDRWKKLEGKEVSCRVWSGEPYNSSQKEICKKKVMSVEKMSLFMEEFHNKLHFIRYANCFLYKQTSKSRCNWCGIYLESYANCIAKNDGFDDCNSLCSYLKKSKAGIYAIVHFTEFRYDK